MWDGSLTAALWRPSQRARALTENLWAVHTNTYDYAADYDGRHDELTDTVREYRREFVRDYYETEHPVVRLNRVTLAGDIPVDIYGQHSRAVVGDASVYSDVVSPIPLAS